MDNYPHKSGLGLIEPVAQINHNVAILWNNVWSYRRVTYLEGIPPFQFIDLGAVAAATNIIPTGTPNLEVQSNEFAQYRWFPLDDVQIRLWLPQASGRYRLRALMSVVDMMTIERDPCLHLTEFFQWEDEGPPNFEALNGTDYALAQTRLVAFGFRFKTEVLSAEKTKAVIDGREPVVRIVCQGMQ